MSQSETLHDKSRSLAPGTIIFQRSFTVRECTDRNDRSVLRGVSSTFAESLIVTNDSTAIARTAVRGAKGHRDLVKSRDQIELLLSARYKSYDSKLTRFRYQHDNRLTLARQILFYSHIMQHPFHRISENWNAKTE